MGKIYDTAELVGKLNLLQTAIAWDMSGEYQGILRESQNGLKTLGKILVIYSAYKDIIATDKSSYGATYAQQTAFKHIINTLAEYERGGDPGGT